MKMETMKNNFLSFFVVVAFNKINFELVVSKLHTDKLLLRNLRIKTLNLIDHVKHTLYNIPYLCIPVSL